MVMLNSVWIIDAKDLMRDDASDFNFMRNNQANLVLWSTIVKKYLYPIIDGVDRGPQISICTKSNAKLETW